MPDVPGCPPPGTGSRASRGAHERLPGPAQHGAGPSALPRRPPRHVTGAGNTPVTTPTTDSPFNSATGEGPAGTRGSPGGLRWLTDPSMTHARGLGRGAAQRLWGGAGRSPAWGSGLPLGERRVLTTPSAPKVHVRPLRCRPKPGRQPVWLTEAAQVPRPPHSGAQTGSGDRAGRWGTELAAGPGAAPPSSAPRPPSFLPGAPFTSPGLRPPATVHPLPGSPPSRQSQAPPRSRTPTPRLQLVLGGWAPSTGRAIRLSALRVWLRAGDTKVTFPSVCKGPTQ